MRLYLSLLTMLVLSCVSQRPLHLCQEEMTVVDRSDLDGCTYLLQNGADEFFLPVNGESFQLQKAERVMVSYQSFDGMSTCMAEQEMITLTCVQRLADSDCIPHEDVQQVPWLEDLVNRDGPQRIDRHNHQGRYYYRVTLVDRERWYDCTGMLVCDTETTCAVDPIVASDGVVIFNAQR